MQQLGKEPLTGSDPTCPSARERDLGLTALREDQAKFSIAAVVNPI